MGKSRFYRKHFGPAGYEHISQDVLGTRPKCVKKTEETLAEGKSCVIGVYSVPSVAVGVTTNHILILVQITLTGMCKRGNITFTLQKSLASRSGKRMNGFHVRHDLFLRTPYLLARCFKFENSIDLAWHNNMYRAYCLASSTLENEVSAIV
jgi:bifunctional polynucleotide phosphatase/kinase